MLTRSRILPACVLALCCLRQVCADAPGNIVVNGDFSGGMQSGPGSDTVPNGWILLGAQNTNLQVENINSAWYTAFAATATAAELAGGNMNGIGVPNGDPDQDCLYQPLTVIAGQQYTVSFSVQVTGSTGNNTLLIPVWNWNPQTGTQQFMMNALYGSYAASNAEYLPASGDGTMQVTFTETAPVGSGAPADSPETVNLMFHGSDVSGGAILLTNVSVVPAGTVAAPTILSSGIVPVYSSATTIESGEWVSIYGANLASSPASWSGDFPVTLGGTSVTIDGNQAFIESVSPGQINVQVPNDSNTGSVPVVVTTAGGSATATATLGQFAPSFLLLDTKHVAGIILRPDGSGAYGGGSYDIIGPTGSSLGYATVAAKAGDSLELFATGLGPTKPAVSAGQSFSGAAGTTNPVTLLINNVSVSPSFAGLSGGGLDQINVTVPPGLGTGDVPLVSSVGGAQTQTGVVISLQ